MIAVGVDFGITEGSKITVVVMMKLPDGKHKIVGYETYDSGVTSKEIEADFQLKYPDLAFSLEGE